MACRAIHSWTLCSLVGAYLDLALAYLLLCGAALAFLAAKFLALFGLALPCPCDGLFGRPHPPCLQRLLVDPPADTIASVHASLRSRFPFDSICSPPRRYGVSLVTDDDAAPRGLLEMGPGESCNSVSSGASQNLTLPGPPLTDDRPGSGSVSSTGRAPDVKGKGDLLGQRPPPPGLRRRRRRKAPIKPPSVSPLQLGWQGEGTAPIPFGAGRVQRATSEESSAPADSGPGRGLPAFCHSTSDDRFEGAALAECDAVDKDAPPGARHLLGSNGNEAVIIRDLEQALEEEQAARAALYLELEEERSAAATAADEAMAMILRLQHEKAAIEMEARQYHRMIEEKSAYDEEEMDILKEIIVRREREKHVLEKEVEGYRQMMLSGGKDEQPSEDDPQLMGHPPGSAFGLSEDPVLMLHQIYESIGKKKTTGNKKQSVVDDGHLADGKQDCAGGFGNEPLSLWLAEDAGTSNHGDVKQAHSVEKHHLEVTDSGYESNLEFQEKGMVTMEVYPSSAQSQRSSYGKDSILDKLHKSQRLGFHEETSHLVNEEVGARDKKTEARVPFGDLYRENCQDADQRGSDSSQFEPEWIIHDVHVIDDRLHSGDGGNGKESKLSQLGSASGIYGKVDPTVESSGASIIDSSTNNPIITSWAGVEQNIHRSCSDMTKGGQLMDNLVGKSSVFGLRRSSMSAVDIERYKLETEVELLRKRLKIIQQGREKLSFSVEHREKESFQLQLLDEIACQLQEIRKITEPEKSVRQASLPPPSSKVSSKKRRCRSVSWGVHDST